MKQYWGKQNKTLAQRLNTQITHSTKHNEITGCENGSTISGTNRRVGNTVEVRSEKLCNSEEKKPMPIMTHQLVCNGETTPTINRAMMKITPSRTIPKSVWETKNKKRMMTPTRRYTIDRMSKPSTPFSTPPPQSSFTMNGVNQTDIPLVSDFKLPPTQTTTMPDSRRLTIQEVQAVFDAILDNKCPPPIDFKIIVVPHDKLAFDPPSCEFEGMSLSLAIHNPLFYSVCLIYAPCHVCTKQLRWYLCHP